MTDHFQKAMEAEKAGRHREAAEHFAIDAMIELVKSNFESGRTMRINAAILLQAISADVRANNTNRARHIFSFLEPLLAEIRDSTDDTVLAGIASEWTGDALLMLGEPGAKEQYREAETRYVDVRPTENWGFEEEFDYEHWAIESFLESEGMEVPENLELDFQQRIGLKLEAAEDLLSE